MINKWRMVHYTDDGCSIYQCLKCMGRWEGRSAPGYFNSYVDTECLVKGGHEMSYQGKTRYYTEREVPLYVSEWPYCPCCGTEWDGPVRCDIDNDRMLGPRRLRIRNAESQQPYCYPDYYYTVETRVIRDGSLWYVQARIDPRDYTAADVIKYVNKRRQDARDDGCRDICPADFRVGVERGDGAYMPTRRISIDASI